MTGAAFRRLALSMPLAREAPHFQRLSFRIGKKIFATMTPDGHEAMVVLYPIDRCFALLKAYPNLFFELGRWTSRMGALGIRLANGQVKQLRGLVEDAYQYKAGPSLRRRRS